MAPRHVPERDRDQVEIIRSFRASGSATVISLWDAGEDCRLPMIRWGDSLYIPVYEGMRLAIDVYNGRDRMIAIPTFIEGANLWTGGPTTPEACEPSHMWEIKPHEVMRVDALMNPEGQRGRPIVITQTGLGATVGEATFGTDAYRGQLRIYERMPVGPETTGPMVPPAQGSPNRAPGDDERTMAGGPVARSRASLVDEDQPAAAAPAAVAPAAPAVPPAPSAPAAPTAAPAARSAARLYSPAAAPRPGAPPGGPPPASYAAPAAAMTARARGKAGFGAGAEEERKHYFTGISYYPEAAQLVSLRTEFRDELEEMIHTSLPPGWNWAWPRTWDASWIPNPWMWPAPPTAPHIPVTRPRG